MIFQQHHLEKIREGVKTQTRRQKPKSELRYKEGNVYRATEGGEKMFQTIEECEDFVRVVEISEEQLGEITESDADAEGGYTLDEFVSIWEDINGDWDPTETVSVIKFNYLSSHPSN